VLGAIIPQRWFRVGVMENVSDRFLNFRFCVETGLRDAPR
jgi:hypothetical protein